MSPIKANPCGTDLSGAALSQKLGGPVWPIDTNPWLGFYFDPACLYGNDRPVWKLLEGYAGNLSGKYGQERADRISSALNIEAEQRDQGSVSIITTSAPLRHARYVLASWAQGNLLEYTQYAAGSDVPDEVGAVEKQINWDYKHLGGIAIPSNVTYRTYNRSGDQLLQLIEYKLMSIEVNGKTAPEGG